MDVLTKTRLSWMVENTLTDYWNDSCSVSELTSAITNGAVGATTNPTIVLEVLKKEMDLWREFVVREIHDHPTWTEEQLAWSLIEAMAVKGAQLLQPVFERNGRLKGRISIQTNPLNYRNPAALVDQAVHFNRLAPNMQVKIPVTAAGVAAIEEATFRGVNINATVSFSLPQAIAVAEAVERGLDRRQAAGLSNQDMSPVCTLMIGRLDDWLGVLLKRDGILADPGCVHWAGIAVFKKAYPLFQARGYRTRLLSAAYRHHLHWTELIGGDIIQTIPYPWQVKFNAWQGALEERIAAPVDDLILHQLESSFGDFRRAYAAEGINTAQFDSFGPTARTLRSFIASYHELLGVMRDFMLPNPDVRR